MSTQENTAQDYIRNEDGSIKTTHVIPYDDNTPWGRFHGEVWDRVQAMGASDDPSVVISEDPDHPETDFDLILGAELAMYGAAMEPIMSNNTYVNWKNEEGYMMFLLKYSS